MRDGRVGSNRCNKVWHLHISIGSRVRWSTTQLTRARSQGSANNRGTFQYGDLGTQCAVSDRKRVYNFPHVIYIPSVYMSNDFDLKINTHWIWRNRKISRPICIE